VNRRGGREDDAVLSAIKRKEIGRSLIWEPHPRERKGVTAVRSEGKKKGKRASWKKKKKAPVPELSRRGKIRGERRGSVPSKKRRKRRDGVVKEKNEPAIGKGTNAGGERRGRPLGVGRKKKRGDPCTPG